MYHTHFGLENGLFGDGIAADSAVFRSPKHEQVVAQFKLALSAPSAALVLRGPAGVGKTTLTASTLRASGTRLALAWLNGMPTNPTELLELVLVELGVNTLRTTRIERLQLWRQFQGEMRATESRLFVVVERTEDLSTEVLHAVDQLTAPDAVGNPGANLVLLGHATIDEHLAAPLLESLRQRIRVRTELTPFTEAELQDYLRHQVACAGGHYDRIFAPGTVAALHRYSGGVARLANTLCETALDLAANQLEKLLTPELLTKTALSVLGLVETTSTTRVAPPATSEPATAVASRSPAVVAPSVAPTAAVATAAPSAAAEPSRSVATAAPAPLPVTAAPALSANEATAPPAGADRPAAPSFTAVPVTARALTPTPTPALAAAPAPESPSIRISPPAAAAMTSAGTTTPVPATSNAKPAPTIVKPAPIEFEFDGGATDITDVAMAEFPVLTDAVEMPGDDLLYQRPAVATAQPTPVWPAPASPIQPVIAARSPMSQPAPALRTPASVPTTKPTAPASSRVETAYTAAKPAAAAPPPPKPAPAMPAAAAPKPAAPLPSPAIDSEDDDLLRQTQTMRAIAVAKSIDDISSSMAETLFGDAELDLVTAALASAAEWPDDDGHPAPAAVGKAEPVKASVKTEPAKTPPADDPWDLFGLGDDAPLELIDDSTLPPANRKSAAR